MNDDFELSWNRNDIERKLGFKSGKYTGVNTLLSFIIAIFMTVIFYGALYPLAYKGQDLIDMFFPGGAANRCNIPIYTVFLSAWCFAILIIKSIKLSLQKKSLRLKIVPEVPDFVLAPNTALQILNEMYKKVDDPEKFILFNRISRCLSNLKNLGRISDVVEGLEAQAENDENYVESTYTLIKGYIWAIPVLGFIGTVLGLSQAVGGFGKVIQEGAEIEKLKASLSGVTSGLAIAFETTLIALVAALFIQLVMTMIRKNEENFLDECSDYCHRNIIAKLKTIGVRDEFDRN